MIRVNRWTGVALAAMLPSVLLIVGTTSFRAEPAGEDLPSLDQIITTLEKQREQVKSLYIETKSYWTPLVSPSVLLSWPRFSGTDFTWQDEEHFAFKGGKRYMRFIQTTEMKPGEEKESGARHVTSNLEQAVDGKICWERRVDLKLGPAKVSLHPYDPKNQWISNPEYCSNVGWDCESEMNTQDESALRSYRTLDLLYLLKKGAYAIGKRATELDGVKCITVRRKFEMTIYVADGSGSKPLEVPATEKLWLDVDHGFAVRQCERDIEIQGLDRTVNSGFVEILPGIWFPRKTEVQRIAPPNAPKEYQGRPVLSWNADLIRWTVNDVPDELFHVVTKPSDNVEDWRTKGIQVIEGPIEPNDSTPATGTLPGSASTERPSAKVSPKPLTAEAASLIDSLAEARSTGESDATELRVAITSLQGRGPNESLVEPLKTRMHCKYEYVTGAEIRAGALKPFDVILVPGGQSRTQSAALGEEGRRAVREFVEAGGGYVGICAGAILATTGRDSYLGLINAKTLSGRRESPGPDGVMSVDMNKRGSGIVKMELSDAGRKVLGGPSGLVDTKFAAGSVFLPAGRTDLPEYVSLAFYRSEVWLHEFHRGTMTNSTSILAARFGKGNVIIFSPHPEALRETQPMLARAVLAAARKPAERSSQMPRP